MGKIQINFKGIFQKLKSHLWTETTQRAFQDWFHLVFSYRGIWCFMLAILGVIFVYGAEKHSKFLILKEYHFFSIITARRVFSIDHLGLLPNEANVHVALEEVLENIAHLYPMLIGILAYFCIPSKTPRKSNSIY